MVEKKLIIDKKNHWGPITSILLKRGIKGVKKYNNKINEYMFTKKKFLKSILACSILVTGIGCKEEVNIDMCSCRFNLDLLLNKDSKAYSKYLKFYDKNQMQKCLDYYKKEYPKDTELGFESVYQYYAKECPNYEINIEKEN